MKNVLWSWKCRRLSLKGKVTVINILAISPLLHLASVIHVPAQVIQEVKKIVVDFIWDSKPPKITDDVMIQSIENGGGGGGGVETCRFWIQSKITKARIRKKIIAK